MQLSRFTDLSLRVLMVAAVNTDNRITTDDVTTLFGVSRNHIVKVIHTLQSLGYLETTRGRGGGFVLARDPETIRVGDIVRDTETNLVLVECFDAEANTCRLNPACSLKRALQGALHAFLKELDRYTLADFVGQRRQVQRLLQLRTHGATAPANPSAGVRSAGV